MTVTAHRDPAYAAAVTADLHSLPTGRLTTRADAAHIFTADLADLEAWLTARGGVTTVQRTSGSVLLWTLHTTTEPRADGTTTEVVVHALALTTDTAPDALTAALTANAL